MKDSLLNSVIMFIVANYEKSSVDRAKLISELLAKKNFRVVYKKVNKDENNNVIMREAFCTLDFENLKNYSSRYCEYASKSSDDKKTNKRKAYESSCISYYDLEKDAFRCFKMNNLVEIEVIDSFNDIIQRIN
jgi:hypothetical protein